MQSKAFWVKKDKIYSVPISKNHIDFIYENANLFNIDKQHIESLYEKHNEKPLIEGVARIEIIKEVCKNDDWIRCRIYRSKNQYYTTIQTFDLDKNKIYVINLLEYLRKENLIDTYEDIRIGSYKDEKSLRFNSYTEVINKLIGGVYGEKH